MKVIGFVGPKGSGKDTAADILKELKKADGKLSFAGPLKELCSEVFNIPIQLFQDPILKERPFVEMKKYGENVPLDSRILKQVKRACTRYLPEYDSATGIMIYNIDRANLTGVEGREMKTPRELLQIIGTNFIRDKIKKDWHLLAAFSDKRLEKLKDNGVYCVTDIRFENELEFLKNKFGDDFECYYVERPEAEERLANAEHTSETTVLNLKEIVGEENILKNDGTIENFKKKVKSLKIIAPKKTSKKKDSAKGSRFVYGPRS